MSEMTSGGYHYIGPLDASRFATLFYRLRTGKTGKDLLKGLTFEDHFAKEVADALAGKPAKDKAKKAAFQFAKEVGVRVQSVEDHHHRGDRARAKPAATARTIRTKLPPKVAG